MKAARAKDYWRRVYAQSFNVRLDKIQFQTLLRENSGELNFSGGITALCGGNGVGKTTLLETIFAGLSETSPHPRILLRLSGAVVTSSVRLNGTNATVEQNFVETASATQGAGVPLTWLDTSVDSQKLIRRFADMPNRDELFDSLSAKELKPLELEIISYLVGKHYDSLHVFEIEDYNGEPPFPYFKIKADGMSYGSETMGLGEMSLLLSYWLLTRIREHSILLLEEPETFISYRSQLALLDVLAKFCSEKHLWCILTTHSPGIVSKIPIQHVRVLFRQAGKLVILQRPTKLEIQSIVGIPPQFEGVFIVEDQAALEFTKAWFNLSDPTLLQRYEIIMNSCSEGIGKVLEVFPKTAGWLNIVGLFDGDMRSQIPPGGRKQWMWPHAFLPGDQSPECLVRSAAASEMVFLAAELGGSATSLEFVLSELNGRDDHDWFIELAKKAGASHERLMHALVRIWIKKNSPLSQTALDAIQLAIGDVGGT